MSVDAHELELYADNDRRVYEQLQVIRRNMQRKRDRGVYDSEKAVVAFMYAANFAAQLYTKEFCGKGPHQHGSYGCFAKATRAEVARSYRDRFERGDDC